MLNIEPTRTILRDEASGTIVHISNAAVSEFIIRNTTQCRTLSRLQELQARLAGWLAGWMRQAGGRVRRGVRAAAGCRGLV